MTALHDVNRRFYDSLWAGARLVMPHRFNTWPLVESLLTGRTRALEVAPGLRPRLPLESACFIDISAPALAKLRERGAEVALGRITSLPFGSARFDLVCALDVVEHVDDDDGALIELSRVTRPGGIALISIPLHPSRWSSFDEFVGHKRRYDPSTFIAKLARCELAVESSAIYGMQPRSNRLSELGLWWLTHNRERALWWYNRLFMPIALRVQRELRLHPGLIATDEVDEVLLVCRRAT
jgi:SAM-dependent methyltransferase